MPLVFSSCINNKTVVTEITDLTRYVDPYSGTGYHGHVFPGAHVSFGGVQAGTTNYVKGWDWSSGYLYSDSIVTGFSHLHLSGTGIGELGDVLITPYTGELKTSPGTPGKSPKDIMQGGILELKMGPLPNKQFGAAPEDRPASIIYN